MRTGLHLGVCTGIGVAATWQVASAIPFAVNQEHQLDMFPVANKVQATPLQVQDGHGLLPEGDGLGVKIDEEFVKAHSTEQWIISNAAVKHVMSSL